MVAAHDDQLRCFLTNVCIQATQWTNLIKAPASLLPQQWKIQAGTIPTRQENEWAEIWSTSNNKYYHYLESRIINPAKLASVYEGN